jgi:excisionase family DNA binding protein
MVQEEYRPALKEFLNMLADLLAERYFERLEERTRKIPELRRLITAKEAGEYLSVSADTLYRLASRKRLPYLKIGERILFDVKALDHWIDRHLVTEKGFKRQELKPEKEQDAGETRAGGEGDFMGLLKGKGKG